MREIKFRAWDKLDKYLRYENDVDGIKEWPYLLAVGFHGLPICVDKDSFKEDEIVGWNRDHNLILMQYTGLKDKNGKEIYEGDIIRRDFEVGRTIVDPVSLGIEDYEIDDSGYWIGVVHYRPSEGYILNKCRKYNDDDELQKKKSGVKIYSDYAVVIGNIYENPELLEEPTHE